MGSKIEQIKGVIAESIRVKNEILNKKNKLMDM